MFNTELALLSLYLFISSRDDMYSKKLLPAYKYLTSRCETPPDRAFHSFRASNSVLIDASELHYN